MICTVCGSAYPEGAKFCMECGAALPIPEAPLPEKPLTPPIPEKEVPVVIPEETVAQTPELPPTEPNSLPREESPAQEPVAPTPEPLLLYQTSPYQAPPQPPSPVSRKPVKKGTHWIPIAIMAVLCVFGFILFLALPYGSHGDAPTLSGSETPWFYNDNGTLYFNEDAYTGPEELTVPELVDGQPVTELGAYCFAGCDFTTVILPDTLEAIGDNAFEGCTYLRGIFLPEGLIYIGSQAFYCCSELEAICIPSTVTTIEAGAFDGCFSLNYILYNGIHSHWLDLYGDMIGKKTQVYCTDGTFVHRHVFP